MPPTTPIKEESSIKTKMTEDVMQKQMNELAALCQRFNDAITGIGENQREISEHIKGQDSKIEEMALKMNVGPETIQTNSTRNPAAIKENNPSPSFSGAIKTVQNWYEGNPQEWFAFKRKIKNLTWALNLSEPEGIRIIKMALAGPAIFILILFMISQHEKGCVRKMRILLL